MSARYRLPPEWGGHVVVEDERHTKGSAPPGCIAVYSRGGTGTIAFFHRSQLEEASDEPLTADPDEAVRHGVRFRDDSYGDAVLERRDSGEVVVVRADDVIGISVELLAESWGNGLSVDRRDGTLWLGGDGNYRYRPVRFVNASSTGEGSRVLVCERVR